MSCCNPTKPRSNNHKLKTAAALSRNVMPAVVTELAVPLRGSKLRGASVYDTLRERREVRAIRRRTSWKYL
ncbi:hypothetical protein [Nostoc sp. 'Peltigera malacea cyanobiont' DB3992]|uniref:hypothetical protein n=1 Tax=Nostoc sp. 'Peltigera malacea cyanobiont' DB3992 TaxID=1206980 RepID=UPI001180F7E7|nr:hypothetical protein [Nostoc sp. 'Peltigera malacea cyanobiont' DB3992]